MLFGIYAPSSLAASDVATSAWSIAGGHVDVRWNRELMQELGIRVEQTSAAATVTDGSDTQRFALADAAALSVSLRGAALMGFSSGSLRAQGGYQLQAADRAINLQSFELRATKAQTNVLDLIGGDGQAWFQLIRPMHAFSSDRRLLDVATMDITLSAALAALIGRPETVGWTVGDLAFTSATTALPAPAVPASSFHWPGDPAPNGGRYEADLFMKEIEFQYSRCDGCTGLDGNGRVVFTPSATLRNNVNDGRFIGYTINNDTRGYSSALWAAGIAWYSKFSGIFAPYQNDQHPYLVWNMYRINDEGVLEQIGRSGAKHAFLTGNEGCLDPNDHDHHVLGRGCSDTYTVSNNDNGNALAPRAEIIPTTGLWGRCRSIFDPNCSGVGGASGNGPYDERLVVRESDISSTAQPGASFLFEAWYVARDDINIYNSMATVSTVPVYSNGWNVNAQSNFRLGPAIDRWVDPVKPAPYSINRELQTSEGHVKVAVKARQVGSHLSATTTCSPISTFPVQLPPERSRTWRCCRMRDLINL